MEAYDTVIIGSGLGGLLCGAILSREGMKVCLLEQHKQAGGCLQNFTRNGIPFDTGMHYTGSLAPGQILYRYWNYLGIMKDLSIEQLDPDGFDRIVIGEQEFPLAQGFENFIHRLLPGFPGSEESLRKFTRRIDEVSKAFPLYNLEIPGNIEQESPYLQQSAFEFFNSMQVPGSEGSLLPRVLAGNRFLYDGNPVNTPLYIPALINHSFISSAWRWVDGSSQIASALVNAIRSNGGDVFTGSGVEKLSGENDGWIVHTRDGRTFPAINVISDIHPSATLSLTEPGLVRKAYTERVKKLVNTQSSFALYITLKEGTFPYLRSNYHVFRTSADPAWPSSYMLYTPPFTGNKGHARALVVMTRMDFSEVRNWENTRTGERGPSYLEFKEMKASKLLDEVEGRFPEIRAGIRNLEISTPLTWRDYTGTPEGSMYGIARDFRDPVRTRIMPRTPLPGLYLTGQNVNIHGALGVTIGAFMTCGELVGMDHLINKVKNAG